MIDLEKIVWSTEPDTNTTYHIVRGQFILTCECRVENMNNASYDRTKATIRHMIWELIYADIRRTIAEYVKEAREAIYIAATNRFYTHFGSKKFDQQEKELISSLEYKE